VKPVPDPAASQPRERTAPANRAPQLIAPNDRTAAAWGVIPAQWPEKDAAQVSAEPHSIQPVSRQVAAPAAKAYDDTLWRSAAE
jgi:hypothetical protein